MGSPDVTAILLTLVTSLLSRVPMLIAVLLGLVLLWRAPQSPLRRAGLAALWLLLGCLFAEVAFQAIPMLLLQQGNVRQISMVVSIRPLRADGRAGRRHRRAGVDAGGQPATLGARHWSALMIPLKAILLVIVGLVCTGQGVWTLLHPQALATVNRGGLLYERFGPNGVGVGMVLMGIAMAVIGLVWARYAWPSRTQHG